jgi:hypothetical protein
VTGYRLLDSGSPPPVVRRLTFVAFLPDGACLAVPDGRGGWRLPAGAVGTDEHWLLDTCLRAPLAEAGFRMQRAHAFAADGDHLYVWLDGDRRADRAGAGTGATTGTPAQIADLLGGGGSGVEAWAVHDAAASFRGQRDDDYYADNVALLDAAYLRGSTVQQGSGFNGDAAAWRARREMIVDGIDRDGTFLDLGCANGLLMESARAWAGERGHHIEPYGVDLAPGLVELARRRLPQWADRIEVGNAIDWRPAGRRRFTYVHTLLDCVPARRRGDLVRHALTHLVEPGGRLLVSHYLGAGATDRTASEHLRALGFAVAGTAAGRDRPREQTAWIDA